MCPIESLNKLARAAHFPTQSIDIGGGRKTGLQLGDDLAIPFRCIMPIGAGFAVAALQAKGFAPGLKFLTRAIEGVVDDSKNAVLPKDYGQVGRGVMNTLCRRG